VLHPLRMMLRARSREERLVAVLHEVVEKGYLTLAELEDEGLLARSYGELDCLTRREESHEAYLERVLTDPLATRVKLLDIGDELEFEEDRERIAYLERARQRIREAVGEGA